MIEETAGFLIQPGNRLVIFRIKLKIKYVQVLSHALFPHGFGDGHHAALRKPAKHHLGHAFTMLNGYRPQDLVLK